MAHPRTRAAVEGQREGPRNPIPRATILAKATEAAAKYLDGTWGPEGSPGSLARAAAWVQSELEDTREWKTQNLMYYVKKVREERRASGNFSTTRTTLDEATAAAAPPPARRGRPSKAEKKAAKAELHAARLEAAAAIEEQKKKSLKAFEDWRRPMVDEGGGRGGG